MPTLGQLAPDGAQSYLDSLGTYGAGPGRKPRETEAANRPERELRRLGALAPERDRDQHQEGVVRHSWAENNNKLSVSESHGAVGSTASRDRLCFGDYINPSQDMRR